MKRIIFVCALFVAVDAAAQYQGPGYFMGQGRLSQKTTQTAATVADTSELMALRLDRQVQKQQKQTTVRGYLKQLEHQPAVVAKVSAQFEIPVGDFINWDEETKLYHLLTGKKLEKMPFTILASNLQKHIEKKEQRGDVIYTWYILNEDGAIQYRVEFCENKVLRIAEHDGNRNGGRILMPEDMVAVSWKVAGNKQPTFKEEFLQGDALYASLPAEEQQAVARLAGAWQTATEDLMSAAQFKDLVSQTNYRYTDPQGRHPRRLSWSEVAALIRQYKRIWQ